jgi:hypothetical protein
MVPLVATAACRAGRTEPLGQERSGACGGERVAIGSHSASEPEMLLTPIQDNKD